MIEVPRAAVVADEIAQEAEFFSFGTNDLTQMTFGFSRDDAGKFLLPYVDKKIPPVADIAESARSMTPLPSDTCPSCTSAQPLNTDDAECQYANP